MVRSPREMAPHGFRAAANCIVMQMHTACGTLAGDIYACTAFNQRTHRAFQPRGNAACAKGFQHYLGITVERSEKGRVKVGRELDKRRVRVERGGSGLRGRCSWDIPAHFAIRSDRAERGGIPC